MTWYSIKSFTWFKTYIKRLQTYTESFGILKYTEWIPALEASSRTARQQIRLLIRNPEFDCSDYKSRQLAPILS
jgi:hypothetical protein